MVEWSKVFCNNRIWDDRHHNGIEGCSENGILFAAEVSSANAESVESIPSMAYADDMIHVAQYKLQ